MLLQVLAVRDSAADAFSRPMFVPTVAMAVRSFAQEAGRPESEIFLHPGDYELFHLAEFDEESGKFQNLDAPRSVARGVDYKERKQ